MLTIRGMIVIVIVVKVLICKLVTRSYTRMRIKSRLPCPRFSIGIWYDADWEAKSVPRTAKVKSIRVLKEGYWYVLSVLP